MTNYYLHLNDQVQGPYTESEIQSLYAQHHLTPDVQVCPEGGAWTSYATVFPAHAPQPLTSRPGLYQGAEPTQPETAAPLVAVDFNPYQAPKSNVVIERAPFVPDSYPGMGRGAYFLTVFLIGLVAAVLNMATSSAAIGFIVGLFTLVPIHSRLKNIGRNPNWCFLAIIPIISLFVTIPCLLFPAGYQDHRKLDLPAKILIGLFIALLLLIVIAISISFSTQ